MPATREIGPRFTAAKYTTRYTVTRASTINSRGINRGVFHAPGAALRTTGKNANVSSMAPTPNRDAKVSCQKTSSSKKCLVSTLARAKGNAADRARKITVGSMKDPDRTPPVQETSTAPVAAITMAAQAKPPRIFPGRSRPLSPQKWAGEPYGHHPRDLPLAEGCHQQDQSESPQRPYPNPSGHGGPLGTLQTATEEPRQYHQGNEKLRDASIKRINEGVGDVPIDDKLDSLVTRPV